MGEELDEEPYARNGSKQGGNASKERRSVRNERREKFIEGKRELEKSRHRKGRRNRKCRLDEYKPTGVLDQKTMD